MSLCEVFKNLFNQQIQCFLATGLLLFTASFREWDCLFLVVFCLGRVGYTADDTQTWLTGSIDDHIYDWPESNMSCIFKRIPIQVLHKHFRGTLMSYFFYLFRLDGGPEFGKTWSYLNTLKGWIVFTHYKKSWFMFSV